VIFYFTLLRENQTKPIEICEENNMIYVKGKEGLMAILKKTVEAMKYILKTHDGEFDFLVRTNISTFINIELLTNFLSQVPPLKYYGGGHVLKCNWGKDGRMYGVYYSQGTGIIFSKDIVEDMCKYDDRFEYDIIDDVSIGRYIRRYHPDIFKNTDKYMKYNALHVGCNCCQKPSEYEIEKKCIFYRNRSWGDRPSDIVKIGNLCQKFSIGEKINMPMYMDSPKKIGILVIYSPSPVYDRMLPILFNYYKQFENVFFYFTQMREEQNSEIILNEETNMIYVKGKEEPFNILKKTVESMKFIIKNHENEFDFLIRSNISTFINISLLDKFLSGVPKNRFYGGGHVLKINWGNTGREFGSTFSQGTSIILSKDLVIHMCENNENLEHDLMDDVAIGRYVRKYFPDIFESTNGYTKYQALQVGCNCHPRPSEEEIEHKCVFYRNRSWGDRPADVMKIDKLCQKFMPIQPCKANEL
jgi:hypothetical protein